MCEREGIEPEATRGRARGWGTGSKTQGLCLTEGGTQYMSSLGPTSRKTHDSELVTSLFWVSVFLSVKWGEGLESAWQCCFLWHSLNHSSQAVSARPH